MSLNYCLMVTGAPYGAHHSASALQFCQTLVFCSHNIGMVFFIKMVFIISRLHHILVLKR